MANNKLFDILFGRFKQYAKLSVHSKLFFKLFELFFGSVLLMVASLLVVWLSRRLSGAEDLASGP